MLKLTPAFLLSLSLTAARAEPPQPHGNAAVIAQASAYLDAYQKLDTAALDRLYAEDAVFNDPTSATVPGIGGPFVWKGRTAILSGLREWAKTTKSLNYDVERRYEASNHVVFVGAVKPLIKTTKGDVQYRYPIVTIVTITNGRVSEHRDYTNYAAGHVVPPSKP